MQKYVKNMDYNELKKLVTENSTLHTDLFNKACDNAYFGIDEYLNGFKGDYEIGGQYDYLHIPENDYRMDYNGFEEWFNSVQHDYELVSIDDEKTIRDFLHYAKIWHKLEYEVYAKDKDYIYVLNKMNDLKEESECILLDRLKAEYDACYEIDTLIETLDIDAYENAFIIDDDYTHLYEHVNGMYVKAHNILIA